MSASKYLFIGLLTALSGLAETLPPLTNGKAPQTLAEAWGDFDPRAEPLAVEVLKEWQEDDVVMRVLRYRVGVFKGKPAMMAAIYGFPKGATKLPGLVQIHGGGQYAHYQAVKTNALRGYATISIAWAGRLSAPDYNVSPPVVKLFWDGKTDDPAYRVTTDWGAIDAYHAPSRFPGSQFPMSKPTPHTLDAVESPRNSPWFLCTLAARRALTFLERQPEVDPNRLGVYGHSMGGKLTVMTTASDDRVKAAAPSCGGISDRDNSSELFRNTICDQHSLTTISCPIVFLSPANDFHGRINDLPKAINEIPSKTWRITAAPHHNHQDTDEYEVATQLWFDQHLKGSFSWPKTPELKLELKTPNGTPQVVIHPDAARAFESIDVYYTQQGIDSTDRSLRDSHIHKFWHHATPVATGDDWTATLPIAHADQPLWVYANVRYKLPKPVTGAGYYYGIYKADEFVVSSLPLLKTAKEIQAAALKPSLQASKLIESFTGKWRQAWFSYKPEHWPLSTNKLYSPLWQAPAGAKLVLDVRSPQANQLAIGIDQHAAAIELNGGPDWQTISFSSKDFKDGNGKPLANWQGIKQLRLSDREWLRGPDKKRIAVGAPWQGPAPDFRNLRWHQRAAGPNLLPQVTPKP